MASRREMKNVSCEVKSAIKNIDCINGGQTEKTDIGLHGFENDQASSGDTLEPQHSKEVIMTLL
jgi:hypothetical protein